MDTRPKVLITGITGYLGAWVLETFLKTGEYDVWGTVRSKANLTKLDPIKNHIGEDLFAKVEIVEVDLSDDASINSAVKGVDFVIHVASPITHEKVADP